MGGLDTRGTAASGANDHRGDCTQENLLPSSMCYGREILRSQNSIYASQETMMKVMDAPLSSISKRRPGGP